MGKHLKTHSDLAFEDTIHDDWGHDLDITEVPIGARPLVYLGIAALVMVLAVTARIIYLNLADGAYYSARARDNIAQYEATPAPRGTIYDRDGNVLAESRAVFTAILNTREFIKNVSKREETTRAAEEVLGISPTDLAARVEKVRDEDFAPPIVLAENLSQGELVKLQALNLETIKIENDFGRNYPKGQAFSSILGYIGRVTREDLRANSTLSSQDFIGKAGIEAYYNAQLTGKPGIRVQYENAQGETLYEKQRSVPQAGKEIHLTIDSALQSYFYSRLKSGLATIGRRVGVGIAMDPRTGEILSLINLPGYDNNLFSRSGTSTTNEITSLLSSPDRPFFDRAVNGYYSPGSTIKPLHGVAALAEGVIDPNRVIFSPGYILVPNPYNSSTPSKYLDWQYQGNVDLSAALAQSSDVYFYVVGGGSPQSSPRLNDESNYGISGLGISRLNDWWKTFGLGKATGIDMPGESVGFLPTPDWKQARTGTPWLLGDTYNVSIGQGDLLLSPFQLLNYITAIANGGMIYRPFLNSASTPQISEDLTRYASEIEEVQKGMREGVTSPRGTSHTLNALPLSVCAKTGSSQIENNTQENALFVGYAPCNDPKIAILILIERAREGSLNAVPVAKDVLNWYYLNRLTDQ